MSEKTRVRQFDVVIDNYGNYYFLRMNKDNDILRLTHVYKYIEEELFNNPEKNIPRTPLKEYAKEMIERSIDDNRFHKLDVLLKHFEINFDSII